MNSKNRIIVKIMGHEYTIKSDDTREYMQRVANLVDDRMKDISESNKSLSTAMISVLTALNISDDYVKLVDRHKDLSDRFDNPSLEIKMLRDELTALKKNHHDKVMEFDSFMVEFSKLEKSNKDYEQGFSNLRDKYSELVSKLSYMESEDSRASDELGTKIEEVEDLKSRLKSIEADNEILKDQLVLKEKDNEALKFDISEKDIEIELLSEGMEACENNKAKEYAGNPEPKSISEVGSIKMGNNDLLY